MKITINGKVTKEALNVIVNEQKEKANVINTFCKKENINYLHYKDNELEYEFKLKEVKQVQPKVTSKQNNTKKKEVETR